MKVLLKYLLLCVGFQMVLTGYACAQNYLWPTNASERLTSSFCEYRPGHYHAAIDIKTWNKEGYPIYAVEDGILFRVRTSPFGYGKVIYIKLKDGRYAVYAHLSRFNKKISALVRKKQYENQRYTTNIYPQNIKVKKGDILGYTGQTGIGAPHLHFEIRNANSHPLNPLRFYANVKDNIKPVLQELMAIPNDQHSFVFSSPNSYKTKLIKTGKNHYALSRPLEVKGKIGLALRGYDKADGVHNRFGFYKSELFIDGEKIFSLIYDEIDFETSKYIETEIHYPEKMKSGNIFHKLYIEPYNQLNIYDRSLGNGLISIGTDTVDFKIEVSDFLNNMAVLEGKLIPPKNDLIAVSSNRLKNKFAFLQLNLPPDMNELSFASFDRFSGWKDIEKFEALSLRNLNDQKQMAVKLHLKDSLQHKIKINVGSAKKGKDTKIICLSAKACSHSNFSVYNKGKYLAAIIQHKESNPENYLIMKSKKAQNIKLLGKGKKNHIILEPNLLKNDRLQLSFIGDGKTLIDTVLYYSYFPIDTVTEKTFFTENLKVRSEKNSFYYPTLVKYAKEKITAKDFDAPIFSSAYHLSHDGQVLRKSVGVKITADSLSENIKQMMICKVEKNNSLRYYKTRYDSVQQAFSIQTSSLGKFVIAADTLSPLIEMLTSAAYIKRNKRVQFKIEDNLSGFGSDKNIAIYLDKQFVIPEWDPERDTVVGRFDFPIKKGRRHLKIEVSDNVGNKTIKQIPLNY
jgi:hypothetical protein